jgi:hypothetical protein
MGTIVLPLEGMNGIGGWALYLFAAVFLRFGVFWVGSKVLPIWWPIISSGCGLTWRSREIARWTIGRPVNLLVVIAATFCVAALGYAFIHLIIFQRAQYVVFDTDHAEFVYRWPWLNRNVEYNSIQALGLKEIKPRYAEPGAPAWPQVIIIISTAKGEYRVAGANEEYPRSMAIYKELKTHAPHQARVSSLPRE